MDVQSEIDERPFLVVIIVCNEHVIVLTNTANVLYQRYILDENFAVREQYLNFKRMRSYGFLRLKEVVLNERFD